MAHWTQESADFRTELHRILWDLGIQKMSPVRHKHHHISWECISALSLVGFVLSQRVGKEAALNAIVTIAEFFGE